MRCFKGFDKNLKCRGFQYEVGREYEEDSAELCNSGFHACENPLDVFGYYPPVDSRYCEVELEDVSEEMSDDSKHCGKRIKIGAEVGIKGIVDAFVEFTLEKVDWEHNKKENTGSQSAATNTGDRSAATNTGNWSAATNTGNWSAATVEGAESIAIATGIESKAKGALGCYIVLAEWEQDKNYDYHIKTVKAHKVDGNTVKPNVFYMLVNGKFTEVK